MSTQRHVLWRWWARFWFADGSAYELAGARIVIATHALWILVSRDLAGASGLPLEFWSQVPAVNRWRYLVFPGHSSLEHALQGLAIVTLVAIVFGVYPRVTCLGAALLLYHLAPLESIIWTPSPYERGFEVTTLSLVVLAVAPCADVWAIGQRSRSDRHRATWEYRWPLVLIQMYVAQIFLFSGYSKLFRVGWSWVSAENLRHWLLVFTQDDQIAVFRSLGTWIADRPVLCFLAALGAVAFDLGFGVLVFWRRFRVVLLPLAFVFHAGILFSMNIAFLNAPQLLVFLPWDNIRLRIARWRWSSVPGESATRTLPQNGAPTPQGPSVAR